VSAPVGHRGGERPGAGYRVAGEPPRTARPTAGESRNRVDGRHLGERIPDENFGLQSSRKLGASISSLERLRPPERWPRRSVSTAEGTSSRSDGGRASRIALVDAALDHETRQRLRVLVDAATRARERGEQVGHCRRCGTLWSLKTRGCPACSDRHWKRRHLCVNGHVGIAPRCPCGAAWEEQRPGCRNCYKRARRRWVNGGRRGPRPTMGRPSSVAWSKWTADATASASGVGDRLAGSPSPST
jgi:hypothetical protein